MNNKLLIKIAITIVVGVFLLLFMLKDENSDKSDIKSHSSIKGKIVKLKETQLSHTSTTIISSSKTNIKHSKKTISSKNSLKFQEDKQRFLEQSKYEKQKAKHYQHSKNYQKERENIANMHRYWSKQKQLTKNGILTEQKRKILAYKHYQEMMKQRIEMVKRANKRENKGGKDD